MRIKIAAALAAIGLAISGFTLSIIGDAAPAHSSHVSAHSIIGDSHPRSIIGD